MKVLMVVAKNNFRDEEYLEPRRILEEAQIKVLVASSSKGQAVSMRGLKVSVDLDLSQANAEGFDGIIFVGGGGAREFFEDKAALSLARAFFGGGKVTAAICIAPVILANAGLLKGKGATVFGSVRGELAAKGAILLDDDVVTEGRLITADGPAAATKFAQAIVKALRG